jgi:arylsulfatase A-like enzyme
VELPARLRSLSLALVALALAGCDAAFRPGRSAAGASGGNVLVIVIDELRADHTSLLGYDRETTPNLAALAREGVVFERAFSPAPWDVPAHVALLSGCDPTIAERYLPASAPRPVSLRWRFPAGAPSLPEEMLRSGRTTAAFSDSLLLGPTLGFQRGFETFDLLESRDVRGPDDFGAVGVLARFRRWLSELPEGQGWFAYVQLGDLTREWSSNDEWGRRFEPRAELDFAPPVSDSFETFFAIPRPRWIGAYCTLGEYESYYDGALARVDDALGKLFAQLRTRPDFAELSIVVVSSHGFSFGEDGLVLDHGQLNDADLRALFVVRPADRLARAARGVRVPSTISLLDLAPTLLELVGQTPPAAMHGSSLAAALDAAHGTLTLPPERRVFARFARLDGFAVRSDQSEYRWLRTWRSDRGYSQRAWFGGQFPQSPRPFEEWRPRGAHAAADGARSSDADSAARNAEYEAARDWYERAERDRRTYWAEDFEQLPEAERAAAQAPVPAR